MENSQDDDNDEELKMAIALSLQCGSSVKASDQRQSPTGQIIDLSSDDDIPPPPNVPPGNGEVDVDESHLAISSFLGLDRKAMEQERLSRKRRASISPPPPRKVRKLTDAKSEPLPLRALRGRDNPQTTHELSQSRPVANYAVNGEANSKGLKYPKGTVKRTWALGHSRENDIKLEEVLDCSDLQLAVLSSFQWDVDWLLSKLNVAATKLIFVMQAKDESTRRQYERETASMSNLRLCFPSMEGQVNCMHSKLMLLAHPDYLRIVIPTANLVSFDWGENGIMENMVFLIDLPRLKKVHATPVEELTFFGKELCYFLEAMGLQESIIASMRQFDFSATEGLAFVHTIGGAHQGPNEPWRRTGYCGLGRAVKTLGLATTDPIQVDFVTSSMGSLNIDFLTAMYLAAQGDEGTTEYDWRTGKSGKGLKKNDKEAEEARLALRTKLNGDAQENFRIYFPTHDTVVASRGGAASGGTICFQSRWYKASTFPRQALRDCKSQRAGLLMHNKVTLSLQTAR